MSEHEEVLSFGLSGADIAWPIVLAMCVALMVLPFVFVIMAKWGQDPDAQD